MAKKYETSAEEMIKAPEIWNEILDNSTQLLNKLINDEEVDRDQEEIEYKLVNVLFSMRVAKDSYEDLQAIRNLAYEGQIEKYNLQKTLRNFLVNTYIVLDVTEKFINCLEENRIQTNISLNKVREKLREKRNQVTHDSVPTIIISKSERNISSPDICHADVFMDVHSENYLHVLVKFNESNSEYDLFPWTEHIYYSIR